MDLMWVPYSCSWRLNERHYGALQGLNKAETAEKYGAEQVHIWRRSYDVFPPPLIGQMRDIRDMTRVTGTSIRMEIPLSESLKDTEERFLLYWRDKIVPEIKAGKRVLITAHGNSLRALVKHLDNLSEAEVLKLEIPTGVPLVYELDDELKAIRHYYL